MAKIHLPSWLRAPSSRTNGTMTVLDHLREVRYRFLVAAAAIAVTTIIAFVFEPYLLRAVIWPVQRAVEIFQQMRPDGRVEMVTQGITAGFALYFKVCFVAGFIAACPIWLYQVWRFIVPGLKQGERRMARRFLVASIPLFLAGVALAYWICPRGFAVLMTFNPPSVTNLNDVGTFMTFELRLLLMFGLAFELPVLLVCLNLLGIVTGEMLGKFRKVAIVLCAVFSAIATPTTDAITMLTLMIPMIAMYLIAEVICRRHDRRVGKAPSPDRPLQTGDSLKRRPVAA